MRTYSLRKRVLVTGGAGFLGSHLCERLLADGCDVLCVDNFFTGTKDNIAHLIGNRGRGRQARPCIRTTRPARSAMWMTSSKPW